MLDDGEPNLQATARLNPAIATSQEVKLDTRMLSSCFK
jgi:hypothetical protein